MTDKSSTLPEKPAADAPPNVMIAKGPRKQHGIVPTRRIKGKLLLKETEKTQNVQRKGALQKKGVSKMGAAKEGTKQVGLKPAATKPDKYVRFRIRVEDGKMSIVDSHLVEGTLLMPSTLSGNYMYEITHGQKRLHLDSIPDLGVKRSFPDPNAPLEERREHITKLSSYEFDVRVPEKELKPAALPKIDIVLYRTKERPRMMKLGLGPLNVQFEKEMREVARIRGIRADILRIKSR
jgi:hypothetical protein